jgi:PHD/YefM family antitoxin component YafN of YafNO toxin-antitoxin module
MAFMTELRVGDDHQVIRLGGETAVVVPLEEYRHLRELERRAQLVEEADAEEAEALAEYREQQAAGTVTVVQQDEVRRRFGLAAQ